MEVIFWGRPSWNPDEETKVACSALGCWRFQELWRLPGYVSVQGRPKVPWNPETDADDSGVHEKTGHSSVPVRDAMPTLFDLLEDEPNSQ